MAGSYIGGYVVQSKGTLIKVKSRTQVRRVAHVSAMQLDGKGSVTNSATINFALSQNAAASTSLPAEELESTPAKSPSTRPIRKRAGVHFGRIARQ